MTFLEAIILGLTRGCCDGGTFHIGDVSVVLRCSSDIWEWEYRGETYWDVENLAESIIRDGQAVPERASRFSKRIESWKDRAQGEGSLAVIPLLLRAADSGLPGERTPLVG